MDDVADYRLYIFYRLGKASTVLDSLLKPPFGSALAPLRLAKACPVVSVGASWAAGQQVTMLALELLERLSPIIVEPHYC